MTERDLGQQEPSEALLRRWRNQRRWTAEEAILLAHGVSPEGEHAEQALNANAGKLDCARRNGRHVQSPEAWLSWGERNDLSFHTKWWLVISPEGPIGFDGRHFAFNRAEMLSEDYLAQERVLIGKWARKPYWTSREAIDISLNFDPFTTDGWREEAPETGATIREREDRRYIHERGLEMGTIAEKAAPLEFLRWLEARGYYVSPAWRRAVGLDEMTPQSEADVARDQELENDRPQHSQIEALEERLHESERSNLEKANEIARLKEMLKELTGEDVAPQKSTGLVRKLASLQKALLAAAVDGYSYNPTKARSSVPQEIEEKASELGLEITAQTIRTHLKESADRHVDQTVWAEFYPVK